VKAAMAKARYSELDKNVVQLVKVLNSFRGIKTIWSCGGHPPPIKPYQYPTGAWEVAFMITRDDHGWFALEFLAWLVNNSASKNKIPVYLSLDAAPPFLNQPGEVLCFALKGRDNLDPNKFAKFIVKNMREYYLSPGMARK
jgi:hypothetical protein